jgi:glycogen operon protein
VFHLLFNAWREALEFDLPEPPAETRGAWLRWLDTSLDAPDDVCSLEEAPRVEARSYRLAPHSIAALVGVIAPRKSVG